MKTTNDIDDMKDAPGLRGIPKVDPFVVPDGFFDRFPQLVQARVAKPQNMWTRMCINMGGYALPVRLAGATAVVALIATVVHFTLPAEHDPANAPIAELTIEPTEMDIDAMDDADLLAAIDDMPYTMIQAGDGLSDEEMATYLEQEELPLDLLIEEL